MRQRYDRGMSDNPLKLRQIHHVEFWVGNAKQAAYYYRKAFGFSQFAYAGLETGQPRHGVLRAAPGQGAARVSHAARRRTIRRPSTCKLHGDGVRDIAFQVDDADRAFDEAVNAGPGRPSSRTTRSTRTAASAAASIHTYGDTLHSFIGSTTTTARSCPATSSGPWPARMPASCASTTSSATSNWARWTTGPTGTATCSGFKRYISFDDKDISTEYSALMSIVMSDDCHAIKFPLNEPATGKRKSQIEEYLGLLSGPGRAAHRAADHRHRAHGAAAARQRRRVPERARRPTTSSCRRASARSTRPST